jgi:hypothetical protein
MKEINLEYGAGEIKGKEGTKYGERNRGKVKK